MARALLATDWTRADMIDAARSVLGRDVPTPIAPARQMVRSVLAEFPTPPRDRARQLAAFLLDRGLADVRASVVKRHQAPVVHHVTAMPSRIVRSRWGVPLIHTRGELAELLSLTTGELHWFADLGQWNRRAADEELRHYRYHWIEKGDGRFRLIEQPKQRLKAIQRRILREIVAVVPVHDAAHGFVTGRSALTAAGPHCGRRVVLRFDLEDFFGSIAANRIYGIFRSCGYPETVAHALTGLATSAVPIAELRDSPAAPAARRRLRTAHLPQGAPTSPALANLAANGLDRRLAGLAARFGATYTRYADDLLFSGGGELARGHEQLRSAVGDVARDEGFRLQPAKTSVMTDGGRQKLLGLVVNQRTNVPRADYDELRAMLWNAARFGPESQRREVDADFAAHLLGRIGWIEAGNPERGQRLRTLYDRIDWAASGTVAS